ncbi:unnamed protein product [Parajaminaea phylloscopi]
MANVAVSLLACEWTVKRAHFKAFSALEIAECLVKMLSKSLKAAEDYSVRDFWGEEDLQKIEAGKKETTRRMEASFASLKGAPAKSTRRGYMKNLANNVAFRVVGLIKGCKERAQRVSEERRPIFPGDRLDASFDACSLWSSKATWTIASFAGLNSSSSSSGAVDRIPPACMSTLSMPLSMHVLRAAMEAGTTANIAIVHWGCNAVKAGFTKETALHLLARLGSAEWQVTGGFVEPATHAPQPPSEKERTVVR